MYDAFDLVKVHLEKKGYCVSRFETKSEAEMYLCSQIQNTSVGFGGSMTLQEMGLYESLSQNNSVFWHWKATDALTSDDMVKKADMAEVYLTSVNALAETGEIVNIDADCNRVASSVHGHQKVYFIVGRNKLAPSCEAAVWRARNVAAPMNARRLMRKTPCAVKADRCYDCTSPDRICKNLSILFEKPLVGNYEVILIHESLGF